jgi:hypothetical protein
MSGCCVNGETTPLLPPLTANATAHATAAVIIPTIEARERMAPSSASWCLLPLANSASHPAAKAREKSGGNSLLGNENKNQFQIEFRSQTKQTSAPRAQAP